MTQNLLHKSRKTYIAILAFASAAALLLAACGSNTSTSTAAPNKPTSTSSTIISKATTTSTSTSTTNVPTYKHPHIFVVVIENLGFDAAMATPILRQLANRWSYASDYFATTHPSLPNYLSLIGGSTFSITSDCTNCFINAPNLPTELSQHGVSWDAYMESVPSDCFLSPYAPSGLYAGKHDPFVYFENIRNTTSLCHHIKPLTSLEASMSNTTSQLAHFIWITPNICNDGHNCSAAKAASWLTYLVSKITSTSAWKNNGALYVTWDEGNGGDYRKMTDRGTVTATGGGGHVLTLIIEPNNAPGTIDRQPLNHYSLLKTIETNFKVPELGKSSASTLHVLP